jgi:hypothetical protein
MLELDLRERDASRLHDLDRGIERACMPGDRNRHVAQVGKALNGRALPDHDRARAHRGIEPDDLAFTQPLHALDRSPFADGIHFERALLKLSLLPAMGEIFHPAFGALGIVLVIDDIEALFGKEALLHGYPPGTVMGVAVALYTDRAGHGTPAGIEPRSNDVMP